MHLSSTGIASPKTRKAPAAVTAGAHQVFTNSSKAKTTSTLTPAQASEMAAQLWRAAKACRAEAVELGGRQGQALAALSIHYANRAQDMRLQLGRAA